MSKVEKLKIRGELLETAQEQQLKAAARSLYVRMEQCRTTREQIWPALNPDDRAIKPQLRVLPLDRLGGEPGKSGNRVIVGYFLDEESPDLFPSVPMVIKVSPAPQLADSLKLRRELKDEYERTQQLRDYLADQRFAVPFDFFPGSAEDSPAVLWSRLTPATHWWQPRMGDTEPTPLRVVELWKHLSVVSRKDADTVPNDLEAVIDSVYALFTSLHLCYGRQPVEEMSLVDHYKWELREIDDLDGWSEPWRRLWGDSSQQKASDLNATDWMNPFFVLEQLKDRTFDMHLGVVHGDLHPKNIVFSHDCIPHIIDFGWSRDRQHVAKDFVLLECNLRFITLPPFVPVPAIRAMSEWIGMNQSASRVAHKECDDRIKLIAHLRKKAVQHMPGVANWDTEYVVPLFVVAFGLMKHCHQAESQIAARYTVLSLAKYVWENVIQPRA